MYKIPVNADDWRELTSRERAAARRVYKSARRAGYSINDARHLVNTIIASQAKVLENADAAATLHLGVLADPQLENWDDEPAWVQRVAGLDGRNQLENGILIFCCLVVVYVIYHISLAIWG